MLAGSLFNVASGLGDAFESDPSVFQASPQPFENLLMNFNQQDQLPGYSSVFGDTSALFGGVPVAQGWSFNPMPQDQASGGLDFSSVFQAAPKDFGSNFSGGFNPGAITFDPSSVKKMSLEDNLNDYIAQGGGKPKNLFAPVNTSASEGQSRQEQRVNAARQGPGGVQMPMAPPAKPMTEQAKEYKGKFMDLHQNPNIRRGMEWLMGNGFASRFNRPPMTREQAAGFLGNTYVETGGMRPGRLDIIEEGSGRGRGLAQYTGARRGPYDQAVAEAKKQGKDPNDILWQLEYLQRDNAKELSGWTKWSQEIPSGSPKDTALYFQNRFFRPGTPHTDRRIDASNRINQYMQELEQQGLFAIPSTRTFATVGPR